MSKVTALRPGSGQGKRTNVFLDGKLCFSLDTEVVVTEKLRVEDELTDGQIQGLTEADRFHRGLDAARHFLSYRPRSESELRDRLQRRGFTGNTQEEVITRLKEQGLIDDMAFAQFWKDNRESFHPRSRWLTTLELRKKGIAGDIIEKVVGTIDDNDSAYQAAVGKARSLATADYPSFRHRLGDYLKRRGFGYAVINHTVGKIWQEMTGDDEQPGSE